MIQIKNLTVLACVDLAEINQSHSLVYKFFRNHKKNIFAANERLVFYSNYEPSDNLIKHIYQAAKLIDISACFIAICGPRNIKEKLKLLSFDENCIEYIPYHLESKLLQPDNLLNENTLCPLPWMHLMISNVGECRACCLNQTQIGSIVDQPLETLFNNEKILALRADMLSGNRPKECSICWSLENQKIKSNRQWMMSSYAEEFFVSLLDSPKLKSLDFRPSNVCNFKCRICQPDQSSLFANEQMQLTDNADKKTKLKNLNISTKWFDSSETFLNQLIDLLPNLMSVQFLGGEPFLIKQLPKFLKIAVDSGHANNIRLHITTNGSIFPDSLINSLNCFKEVQIALSIDALGHQFEYERGGNWNEIEKNISKFQSQPKLQLTITPTVNVQNVLYLDEVVDWAQEKNIKVLFNYVDNPSYFNIDNMTDTAKNLVITKYQNHRHKEMRLLAQRLQTSTSNDGREFVEFMQTLDKHRGQNFINTHKEIALAMGYAL